MGVQVRFLLGENLVDQMVSQSVCSEGVEIVMEICQLTEVQMGCKMGRGWKI